MRELGLVIVDMNQRADMVSDDDSACSNGMVMFVIACECKCEAPVIVVRWC